MAEALRCLVLQPLPLVLQLQDVLLDPRCAKAFLTQNLLSLFDGVLREHKSDKGVCAALNSVSLNLQFWKLSE